METVSHPTFDLNPEDYYAFLRFQVPRDPQMRALHRRLHVRMLQLVAAIAGGIALATVLGAGAKYSLLVRIVTGLVNGAGFAVIAGVVYAVALLHGRARGGWAGMHVSIQRRAIERGEFQMTFGTHEAEISPDGYSETNADGTAVQRWDRIVEVAETPEHIFLYKSANVAYIIPKRAFADERAVGNFLADVAAYRGAAAAPIRS